MGANSMSGHGSSRLQIVRLYAVIVCLWSSLYLFVPILTPFAEHRGASLQTVGWLVSSYGLTQLLLRIPLGMWSDRLKARKPFILYGFVASFIGALGLAYIDAPEAMIIFRGLTGVCASMWVMLSVWYASTFDAAHTAKAMGLAMVVTNSTQLVSNLTGGVLADTLGWQAPFIAAALLAGVGLAITLTLEESASDGSTPPRLKELLGMGRDRSLLTVSLLAALMQCLPFMTVYGFTSVYAVTLGATKTQLGIITFAAGLPNALFAYLSGSMLVPSFGVRKVVLTGFTLAAVSLSYFPYATSVWTLIALQVLVGSAVGLISPTLMARSIQTVPAERRATAMGFFQSLYSLGMFGGPAIGGFLGQYSGLTSVFRGAAAIALVGVAGSYVFLHEPRQGRQSAGPGSTSSVQGPKQRS